jgi:hypothetical protein
MKISFRVGRGRGSGNQFMARGLLSGLLSVIRLREIINLFSYIKKTMSPCSEVARTTDFESNIIKAQNFNSFIKKQIDVISKIDRIEVTT